MNGADWSGTAISAGCFTWLGCATAVRPTDEVARLRQLRLDDTEHEDRARACAARPRVWSNHISDGDAASARRVRYMPRNSTNGQHARHSHTA